MHAFDYAVLNIPVIELYYTISVNMHVNLKYNIIQQSLLIFLYR